jgi:hypothetical protein
MTRSRAMKTAVAGALLLSASTVAMAGPARVDIRQNEKERRVEILVDGQLFTAYIWPQRLAKPVLYPIRTASGSVVTRSFPLEPRAGERDDHPHQVGLWFNHGDLNGVDFWNNSEARSAEERAKMGTIRHVAVEQACGGVGEGALAVALQWVMPDGSTAIEEHARYTFTAGAGRRAIDRATTLTATGKPAVFTDNKEGMFAMRVARALEQPSKEPVVFTDAAGRPTAVPRMDNSGVTGLYTSSEGLTGDAVWGKRARWVALSGKVDAENVVLLILDHPKNPGHPTYWHARGYGLFAANPLGAKVFSNGKEELNLTIEPGQKVGFRHRLVVLSGSFSAAKAETEWKQFASEPQQ